MMIWVVGGLLVLLAAAIGFFLGALRSAVSLIGALFAAALAGTVGGWLGGVVPLIGFKNQVWMFYVPPLIGFLVVSIVFLVIALVVHHVVHRYYRNNTDEYTFARWDRLNRRAGIGVGAAVGTVWFVLVGIVVHVPGYLSTQFADSEEAAMSLRAVNALAHGAEDSGLVRVVEAFKPASDTHYVASDVIGLVYNNPALQSRLASYPPFLGLAEKPEVAELTRDPKILSLIQMRAGLAQILEHPRIRAVADNPDLVNELLSLDFRDLDTYLRSGVSPKYREELILGRWRLNVRRSVAEMKTTPTDKLPAVEFNLLRKALNVYLDDLTIGFTTDNKAILKVKAKDDKKLLQTVGLASAPSASAGAAAGGGTGGGGAGGEGGGGLTARSIAARPLPQQPPPTDNAAELMRQRYGVAGGGGAQRAQPLAQPLAATPGTMPVRVAPKPPTTTQLGPLMTSGEGGWSKSGDNYRITFSKDGKDVGLAAQVKENQLVAVVDGRVLVFDRI